MKYLLDSFAVAGSPSNEYIHRVHLASPPKSFSVSYFVADSRLACRLFHLTSKKAPINDDSNNFFFLKALARLHFAKAVVSSRGASCRQIESKQIQ